MPGLAAVEGAGEHRVLVLHGWALDSGVWLATRALSDQRHATYAYFDFPGYGTNADADPADGLDEMARAALAAVDELGWTSFSVLGHSMGGATAIRVATLRPDAVRSVVALTPVSPAGTPLDSQTYDGFKDAWADPGAAVKGALSPHMEDDDLQRLVARNRASMNQRVWESYLSNWTGADFMGAVSAYDAPTTIFYGDTDPFVTQEYLRETVDALTNGRLLPITGAGHYPMIEAPRSSVIGWESALGF